MDQFSKTKVSINLGNLEKLDTEKIKNNLNELKDTVSSFPDKKVSISFGNLQTLDVTDLSTKLTNLSTALAAIPEDLNGFSVKGLSSVNKLLQFDTDPKDLAEKFTQLSAAISQFATEVSNIKITDDSFVSSIDNLISHGDKLADLATVIRAKQSEIDNAKTEISARSGIEEEIQRERQAVEDLIEQYRQLNAGTGDNEQLIALDTQITQTEQHIAELQTQLANLQPSSTPQAKGATNLAQPYKDAMQEAERYYELCFKGKEISIDEVEELKQIEAVWYDLYQNVNQVTQALQAQGKSTQSLKDFSEMYANRTKEGLEAYVQSQLKDFKLGNMSEWIDKNILAASKDNKFTAEFEQYAKDLQKQLNEVNIKSLISQGSFDELERLHAEFLKLQDDSKNLSNKIIDPRKVSGLADEISKYLDKYTGLTAKFKNPLSDFLKELQGSNGNMTIARFNDIRTSVDGIKIAARDAGVETKSFWTKVGEQINHTNAQMVSMYFSFYRIIGYIRQTAQEVIKLDSALTELRKVSDASTERLAVSFEQSAKTAKELGNTIDSVINQTADWSRVGFSIDEAEKLARVTTLFQTVGDNMTTDSASSAMISTLKAYEMGVDQAEDIVDKYNIIANNFSINTQGLADAIERSGGALKAASNTFAESLAIITAGNASIQDPTSVAQLLKTMSMRLNGASAADLEALGIDTTGMSGGKKSIIQQYKHMAGINIMEGTNYKSTFQILDELYNKWDSLTMAERQAIAEASGGKRAGSVFASLMTNWKDAREVVKMAEKSQNSAQRELENASNSVNFSLNRLKSSWQELAHDFMQSKALKQAVEALIGIVNAIDNVTKSTKGLVPVLVSVGAGLYVFGTFTGLLKPVIGLMKMLTKVTEDQTKATLLDTIANKANALSEKLLGKAKRDHARDSATLTAQQRAESAAQSADIGVNSTQTASERLAGLNNIGGGLDDAVEELGGDAASGSGLLGMLSTIPKAALGATAAIAAIGVVVGTTAALINQRNEELRDSASKLAESYKESSDEIAEYKEEISDLHDKINDSTTTYDEAKAARERLLEIQDTLIQKYQGEKNNIDLVTSAINGQIDALDRLNEREWQKTKNEYNKQKGIGWVDFWNRQTHGGAADNIGIMQYEMNNAKARLQAETFTDIEFLKQLEKLTGGEFIANDFSNTLDLSGDLEGLLDKLYQIQTLADNIDISDNLKRQITDIINTNEEIFNKDKNMYDLNTLYEDIFPKYKDELSQFEDAYNDYSEAIVTKDAETKQQLLDNAKEGFVNAFKSLKDKDASQDAVDYFKELYPDAQGQIGLWQLEAELNLIPTIKTEEVEIDKSGIEKQLKEYSKGGNVDLTKRPQIPTQLLKDVGWDNAGEGTATTLTNTYTSPDEKIAVNFTPIITDENGNYVDAMEPEALQHYAEGVINGEWADDLKLQIGSEFKGDDAIQQAVEAAEKYHQLQEEFYLGDATEKRETEVYNLSDQANELIEAARLFENEKDIINFNEGNLLDVPQKKIEAFSKFKKVVDDFGISYQTLLDRLRQTGNLNFLDKEDTNRIANKIQEFRDASQWKDNGFGSSMISAFKEQERDALKEAINASGDDYETILAMGDTQWESIAQKADALKEETGEITLSTDEWLELLREGAEEYRNIQKAADKIEPPELNLDTFAKAADKIKGIQAIWQSINDQSEEGIKIPKIDISSLTGLDEEIKALDSFDDVAQLLASGTASAKEQEAAINSLATEYVYSSDVLSGLNSENRDFYIQQLELKGVTNANAIVTKELAEAYGYAGSKGIDLANATDEEIVMLLSEGDASETTIAALQNLLLQKIATNAVTVNTAADCANLMQLVTAAGLATKALGQVKGQQVLLEKAESARKSGKTDLAAEYEKSAKSLGQYVSNMAQEEMKNNTVQLGDLPTAKQPKGKGGGGGGSKKDKEEEKDILAELSKQLDEIQAAYKSLNEIVEAYNANGKLTVDQAQALINTDFRYLAMLTDVNGQLRLNEQGMQDLAKAKITEMQIQLARNAIDTVNKLQSEADAINFLKYAYEGLAGATLDATEAQLQMAVAAAKARGEAQGSAQMVEAAEKIYQGYLATKKAIGNTDFSKESLSGDTKDKDKEKTDKDKSSKKEKDTKTRFNWLEKLVNKIQRSIDKLANRIDKYFTYQQKNALVDKQISANRKMINTQEVAVDYYQKQASKALKKVPKKYRKLVSGDFDPATVKKMYADVGEKGTKKLQTYLDWQSLLEGAQDALEAAYDSERELITSKLDNILTYFDALNNYQQSIINKLDSQNAIKEAKGQQLDINDLLKGISNQQQQINDKGKRDQEYADAKDQAINDLNDSYNEQIGTITDYSESAAYKKIADSQKDWAMAAKSDLKSSPVLADDVDEYLKLYKKYWKAKEGSTKEAEYKAEIDKLKEKYKQEADALNNERNEAIDKAKNEYDTQVEDNETDTNKAIETLWENVHNILNSISQTYDNQIKQLNIMVEKYTTIADLVSTVSAEALKSYGIEDIFGSVDRATALSNAYNASRESVGQYREKYDVYKALVDASQNGGDAVASEVQRLLADQNISEDRKADLETLLNQIREKGWQDGDTWVAEWQESLNEAQNGIAEAIKNSEDYLGQLLDGILDASRKEVEKLTLIADKYGTVADLLNEFDASILEKYGVGDVYNGTKNQALSDAINATKEQIGAEKRQFDLYDKLISAFKEGASDNDKLGQLGRILNDNTVDEETKNYVREIINKINSGIPVGTSDDLAEWQKAQQQNLSNISGEIKKSQGYLQQMSSNLIEASEKNINNYTAIIDRFGTIADLLGEVNSSVLKGYGVAGIFGGYDKYTNLAFEVNNSKLKVAEQKETYTLYSQLASAFLYGEEVLFSRLSKIYSNPNLSAEQKDTVKELLDNYKTLNTEEERKKWEEERDRLLKDISNTIKTSEAALDAIFNGITESSNKEVEQLKTLSEKFSTIADLLSSTNETILKNYGITNMFGEGKTSYISNAISSTKDEITAEEKQYSLYTKLITALTSNDKVGNLWKVMNSSQLSSEMRDIIHSIIIAMANGAPVDTDKYVKQFKEEQNQSLSELSSSISKVESLHRQLLAAITETNDKMIESYESMQAVFSAKASIINEDWLTDVNGITEYGYAKAATLAQELSTAQKEIDAKYNNVRDIERNKNQYISALGEDEYNKAYNEAVQAYYEEIAGAQQLQNQIYELSQKAMTAEIDRISKLVDNYKKALNAKKSYYDYDKTLREKNKNIESLESQIAALTNVTDAASKARMKSLQAELEEAQEDLKDTVYEHSISVENDALDDLLTTLNESIDNSTKTIAEVIKDFTSSVDALITTADGYNTDWSYSKLVDIATGANALSGSYGDVLRTGSSVGSVKQDMANGKYSAVSAANATDKYSAQVLNILTNTNKMLEFQSEIKSATNYMPAISNSLNSIRDNVGTITKNTSRITGQLDQMQYSMDNIGKLISKQNDNLDYPSQMFRQMKKTGNVRIYR